MVVGRNNGVVGLTGFSDKKMSGLLFGPQKSGHYNGVVVWRGSTVVALRPGGRGGTSREIGWGSAAAFLKPLPYFRPNSEIFPTHFRPDKKFDTLFQT